MQLFTLGFLNQYLANRLSPSLNLIFPPANRGVPQEGVAMRDTHGGRRELLIALAAAAAFPVVAADGERRVPVTLEPGVMRSFDDEIVEYEVAAYIVPLRQGQTLQVLLVSNNASNCFDIHAPGVTKPVYVGSESGNSCRWTAARAGDHIVKVFLLRLAARDGQSAKFTLELKTA